MTTVSFDADIKPLFAQFVAQMRWRFDLTSYDDVKANANMIYAHISGTDGDPMPPPPFDPLTQEQIDSFKAWMDQGFPA
jgi:hypothetical protein